MDTLPYRFIGRTDDGLLIFEEQSYPSDAPQTYVEDAALRSCDSTSNALLRGGKYFTVTLRHAEVRGFLHLALKPPDKAGAAHAGETPGLVAQPARVSAGAVPLRG